MKTMKIFTGRSHSGKKIESCSKETSKRSSSRKDSNSQSKFFLMFGGEIYRLRSEGGSSFISDITTNPPYHSFRFLNHILFL